MSHTKGPWTVGRQYIYAFPPGSDFETPHAVAVVRKTVYKPEASPKIREWEANAHLIAAAPEMLEALEHVKGLLRDIDADKLSRSERAALEEADAYLDDAITKARGAK